MNILVTGCAGFIGSNLCRWLLLEGHTVIGVDNLCCGFMKNMHDYINRAHFFFINEDVRKLRADHVIGFSDGFVNKIDAIVHLAARGELYFCDEQPEEAISINVGGTVHMINVAKELGAEHFLFADTSAEYDNVPMSVKVLGHDTYPTKEWVSPDHYAPKGNYSISKMAASEFVRSLGRTHEMTTTIFRPFNVYGPQLNTERDIPPVIGGFANLMLKDVRPTIYGDGSKRRDFIYVQDAVNFISSTIEARSGKGDSETINMGTGENWSIWEIFEFTCKSIYGSDTDKWPEPIYKEDKGYEAQITLADTEKSHRLLGWKPTMDIQDGIDLTVQSMIAAAVKALD